MRKLLMCEHQISKSYEQLVELNYIHICQCLCFALWKIFPKAVLSTRCETVQPRFVDRPFSLSLPTLKCFFLDYSLYFILTKTLCKVLDQLPLLMSLRFCWLALSTSLWEPQRRLWKDKKVLLGKRSKQSLFKLYSEGFCYMLSCPKECFSLYLSFGRH